MSEQLFGKTVDDFRHANTLDLSDPHDGTTEDIIAEPADEYVPPTALEAQSYATTAGAKLYEEKNPHEKAFTKFQ